MKIKCTGEYKPKVATDGSAGIDLYNNDRDFIILEGETYKINTKTSVEIPQGYVGLVIVRSGLGFKGLDLINSVGVIDSDYRGEVGAKVILHPNNNSPMPSTNAIEIRKGERFAQLVIVPYYKANLEFVDELTDTERGDGGFGSTGTL